MTSLTRLRGWCRQRLGRQVGLAVISAVVAIALHLGHWANLADSMPSPTPPQSMTTAQTKPPSPAQFMAEGKQAYAEGRYALALQHWQAAYSSYQQARDQANQVVVLGNLALAYEKLGQWAEANQAIAAGLAILPTLDLSRPDRDRRRGQMLNIQGSLQLAQGQTEAALITWQQATTALEQASDAPGVLRGLINQSQALRILGLYPRAQAVLDQVYQRLQSQPASLLKAAGLLNYGDALQQTGDLERAKLALEQSLAIVADLPVADLEVSLAAHRAAVFVSLGNLNRTNGQLENALKFYQQAATVAPTPLLKAQAHLSQLRLLLDSKQWETAIALTGQMQPQVMALPANRAAIYARIGLAQGFIRLADGDIKTKATPPATFLTTAMQLLTTAAQQAKALADSRAESFALGNLGKVYEKAQRVAEAQQFTQRALILAQASNAPDIAYRWQWHLGQLLARQGQNQAAIAAYDEAVNGLSSLRNDLVSSNLDLQFTFRESVEPIYREFVSLLLRTDGGQTSQTNLIKARTVIESLQLAELDNYFREACLTGKITQIDRVDPTAAVIYPIVLSDRIEVVISWPDQTLRHYATPIPQANLEKLLSDARRVLGDLRFRSGRLPTKLAQDIYNLLLRSAEADLQASGVKTLVFVLDGALRNIPMAVLYDGQQYLVEKYSIAFTPSLQLLSPKPLAGQKIRVLIGGLSEARPGFAALPGVKAEVQQIQAELPAQVLFNQNFTSQTIQNQIASAPFPVVHLATHGQFSSSADDTFILAWDNRINVRQLGEVLRSREEVTQTPIELLVLSACQTAEGDRRATLGLAGVAVRSGARSTLATLWPVDDQATFLFMTQFYRELAKGSTKAEAIRQAQLLLLRGGTGVAGEQRGMRVLSTEDGTRYNPLLQEQKTIPNQFSQPYFWAPFVLVGNWL